MLPSRDAIAERFSAITTHLRGAHLDAFARALHTRQLEAGQVVVQEGTRPEGLFFVWEGTLAVTVEAGSAKVEVGRLEQGAIVGEISFLDGGLATATVSSVGPATVLALPRSDFDTLIRSQPDVARALLHGFCDTLAKRIRAITRRYEELAPGSDDASSPPDPQRRAGLLDRIRLLFGINKA